ncbi:TonB-dependent receptor [Sphingomonas sp. ID0503]|uniref:TonB-dependent receptor n=1 Tax=Sphingomonas sp. ID0503 TaxID=3399691 RepID=UPI003AFB6C27
MGIRMRRADLMICNILLAAISAVPALAQDAATTGGLDEIIVTAQKRSQSINDVPVSLTVASGNQLRAAGVASTADLAKVVPGLTAQPSPINTPVYTLRGVGFFEFSLAATPTVAVYNDEVPLPFGAMSKATGLDLERVEVLKGPQGTLFGQNTTGGAINFIAAKPTNDFRAGVDAEYGRFNTVDVQGFVSGPLTNTLKARIALRVKNGDAWQKNPFRDDSLGKVREKQGRILVDWEPADRLKVSFNVNGWTDKSDSQAPQRTETFISSPGNPNSAIVAALPPLPNYNNRTADWSRTGDFGTERLPLRHDDNFIQGSARIDFELSDDIKLSTISAYERYKTDSYQDYDGSALNIADLHSKGKIETFSQEIRLSGSTGGLIWTVGGNYEDDRVDDAYMFYAQDASTSYVAGPLRGGPAIAINNQRIKTYAVFGNVEYEIAPRLNLIAGARYTDRRAHQIRAGLFDTSAPFIGERHLDPNIYSFPKAFTFLQTVLPPFVTDPITLTPTDNVTFGDDGYPLVKPLTQRLNEDNVSWRAGINYKTANRGLIYATVSKGYKAGSFPTTAGATVREYRPVTQESLLSYEVGFKQPLFDRKVQVNGAAFYYDYKDKQLRGRVLNPIFGPLDALVQIPKSRVWGVEGEVTAQPVTGLQISAAATYINTKIKEFVGFNQSGVLSDYSGFRFPFSPKLSIVAAADYEFPVSDTLHAFVGVSSLSNSSTTASIGDIPQLRIKGYTLVDARLGLKSPDDVWRFSVWGRNLFNTNYWTSANQSQDVYVRFTGRPVTYGASVGYRF